MNSGRRSAEHNREVGGVSNSMHLGNRPGVQGYDTPAIPGVSIEQAAAKIEADNPGIKVVEARDERGRVGPNGKRLGGYHFALANVGGVKPRAAPKRVTPTESDAIEAEMGRQFDGDATALSARARNLIMSRATAEYQRTGSLTGAVATALRTVSADGERAQAHEKALRTEAEAAIARGAPRDGVALRYREKTGKAF